MTPTKLLVSSLVLLLVSSPVLVPVLLPCTLSLTGLRRLVGPGETGLVWSGGELKVVVLLSRSGGHARFRHPLVAEFRLQL